MAQRPSYTSCPPMILNPFPDSISRATASTRSSPDGRAPDVLFHLGGGGVGELEQGAVLEFHPGRDPLLDGVAVLGDTTDQLVADLDLDVVYVPVVGVLGAGRYLLVNSSRAAMRVSFAVVGQGWQGQAGRVGGGAGWSGSSSGLGRQGVTCRGGLERDGRQVGGGGRGTGG